VDPDLFADRIWAQEASLSRAAQLPAGYQDLLSLADADTILSRQALRTPFLRVAKDGVTLPASAYTSGGGTGAGIRDQASDVRLAQLFGDGATIVLQALHRTHAPVIDFAQALGTDLGHPVQVNAYLTPPQSQGFSAHYDVHDVFVLQVAGEKRWRIHAPIHPAPLRDQPWTDHRAEVEAAAQEEPLIDEVLRPGDALYLPRGYLHAATALGGTSAHLTVGVHVWTRRHLLEQLLAATADDEELRRSLPLGIDITDPQTLDRELSLTLGHLAQRLNATRPEQVAAGMIEQALGAARAAPVGPLAQATAAAGIQPGDRLRWRPALRVAISAEADQLVIRSPDGVVRLPDWARASLERLRSGEILRVADLDVPVDGPQSRAEARIELGRSLLHGCLVVPA
jgi:hypothetical protein